MIYVLNNFILSVAEKRNKAILFIKENEIKNITRKDCNNMVVNKQKYYKKCNKEKRIYIYIIISFSLILPINNNTSNITLVVKGPGLKRILSSLFNSNYYPNVVIINGIENTTRDYKYYLPQENNIVKLIWYYNNVDKCVDMFRDCHDITEIDLSNFNTSDVTYMNGMFRDCSQLTSLDLSNFNTSKVTFMFGMFIGCSQLTSIDLSNFDTSKVTYMGSMFSGCSQLTSIDLSNFDTS